MPHWLSVTLLFIALAGGGLGVIGLSFLGISKVSKGKSAEGALRWASYTFGFAIVTALYIACSIPLMFIFVGAGSLGSDEFPLIKVIRGAGMMIVMVGAPIGYILAGVFVAKKVLARIKGVGVS